MKKYSQCKIFLVTINKEKINVFLNDCWSISIIFNILNCEYFKSILVHLAKGFQVLNFRKRSTHETGELQYSCSCCTLPPIA